MKIQLSDAAPAIRSSGRPLTARGRRSPSLTGCPSILEALNDQCTNIPAGDANRVHNPTIEDIPSRVVARSQAVAIQAHGNNMCKEFVQNSLADSSGKARNFW